MNGTYYQHILAAIDLSEDNRKVIEKAVDRARSNGAKLSVIHVDVDLKDLYTEMIDIDIDNVQDQVIAEAKEKHQIDLLVCGHRQSFWSLLTSSARQLMNTVPCDLLVVPLQK